MAKLVFVDCETTGLDPLKHEIWDLALIVREDDGIEQEYSWFIKPDLAKADGTALQIGRYYERTHDLHGPTFYNGGLGKYVKDATQRYWSTPGDVARRVAKLTSGAHLVGMMVHFDAQFLKEFLQTNEVQGAWSYHFIEAESLARGWLERDHHLSHWELPDKCPDWCKAARSVPWKSDAIIKALDVDETDRHTALGDARITRDIYDSVVRDIKTETARLQSSDE